MFSAIDIEDTIRKDLGILYKNSNLFTCLPIPEDLGKQLPLIVIQRFGGSRLSQVIDNHTVGLDVYAKYQDEAVNVANSLCDVISILKDTSNLSIDYLDSELSTLPYNNPDPLRPNLCRVSFSFSVTTRTK